MTLSKFHPTTTLFFGGVGVNKDVQQVIMQAFVTCQFYGGLKADFPDGIKDCHVINIHLVYTVDIF